MTPTWPHYDSMHAIVGDPSHDRIEIAFLNECLVRIPHQGKYYLVLHRNKYVSVVPSDAMDSPNKYADFMMTERARATQQFVRQVEISKMLYVVQDTDRLDHDQTPENVRIQNLIL